MEVLQFPKGSYYQIIARENGQALKIQEGDSSKYFKSRIVTAPSNPTDDAQIFMVDKSVKGDNLYEIVNCASSLVLTEKNNEIILDIGAQKDNQLYSFERCNLKGLEKFYWLKNKSDSNKSITLEGFLRQKTLDVNTVNQLFCFEPLNPIKNKTITESAVLVNSLSGKALDVPGSTFKKGERLIQWEINRRFNQRFRFLKSGKGVIIQNVLNGLVLDIAQEKKDNGAKVVQWDKTGGSNQQWFPEASPKGKGIYKFRSCHEPSLFLAIRHQSANDGGELEVCNQDNDTMHWRVDGALPI